ncbi:hypothetical protein HD554DRAFT_383351 [Boletus coccyginus]|nr:hypothetical protein HD554DRAFT_383351 [Boletus coccyginus]
MGATCSRIQCSTKGFTMKKMFRTHVVIASSDVKTGRRSSRLTYVAPLKVAGEMLRVLVYMMLEDKTAFRKCFLHLLLLRVPTTPTPQLLAPSHYNFLWSYPPCVYSSPFPRYQWLSPLPAHRGPGPIQRALMAGERCVIEKGEVSRRAGKLVGAGGLWDVERMHVPEGANFLHMQQAELPSGWPSLGR